MQQATNTFVQQLGAIMQHRQAAGARLKKASGRAIANNAAPVILEECRFCPEVQKTLEIARLDYAERLREMEDARLAMIAQHANEMEEQKRLVVGLKKALRKGGQAKAKLEDAKAKAEFSRDKALEIAYTQEQKKDLVKKSYAQLSASTFYKNSVYVMLSFLIFLLAAVYLILSTNNSVLMKTIEIQSEALYQQDILLNQQPPLAIGDKYGNTFFGCVARLFY
jgi:hypothetical protein